MITKCFTQHSLNVPHNCDFLLCSQWMCDLVRGGSCLEKGKKSDLLVSKAYLGAKQTWIKDDDTIIQKSQNLFEYRL